MRGVTKLISRQEQQQINLHVTLSPDCKLNLQEDSLSSHCHLLARPYIVFLVKT